MGRQERKEAKTEREVASKSAASQKKVKEEDEAWSAVEKGEKSKAASKREEEERKKAEAAAKKLEAKRLADEEEAALSKAKAKAAVTPGKVTAFQLALTREQEEAQRAEELRVRELAARREVAADHYASMIPTENVNRLVDATAARSVEAALAHLGVKDEAEPEKHPEKRAKAAFKAYEEATLPALKQEKPGLKMSQYKEMLWKSWQKAPENPFNQAAAAALAGR